MMQYYHKNQALKLEIRLAEASMTKEDRRNFSMLYNPHTLKNYEVEFR